MKDFNEFIHFVRNIYKTNEFIPLHEPKFIGNEKKYLNECIDSSYVSSVGNFVNLFEQKIADFTGAKYAIATVNGTAALHMSLILSDVSFDDEVITQPLSFIATSNAITYVGAKPIFIDVDLDTMGLSPEKLEHFLKNKTNLKSDGFSYNNLTGKRIAACIPMHTFGHPVRIEKIAKICSKYNIKLIEDAAESLGSFYKGKHTGIFGSLGTISFNGNKTITTGGGGMIICNDEKIAKLAKHLTTQAKVSHKWEYIHDHIGYNYRLTNLAASLGVSQMEQLDLILKSKRDLANKYMNFFENTEIEFFNEPKNSKSNFWLNSILLKDKYTRDMFLDFTNKNRVMTRPVWELVNRLEMFKNCQTENIENAELLADRVVNIPSSSTLNE